MLLREVKSLTSIHFVFLDDYDVLDKELEAQSIRFRVVLSDSHKNDAWQGYVAVMTASYAKERFGIILEHQIARPQTATAERCRTHALHLVY